MEAMIASVLLAVTVIAVSGAISASYAQEAYAARRMDALKSGAQLIDEVSALPIDPASASNPSIMGYNAYTDTAPIEQLKSVVGTSTSTTSATSSTTAQKAKRTLQVVRKTSLAGATSAAGDFAIVGVVVDNGDQQVKLKRLVTSAEATATH